MNNLHPTHPLVRRTLAWKSLSSLRLADSRKLLVKLFLLLMLFSVATTVQARRVGVFCFLSGEQSGHYADGKIRAQILPLPDGQAVVEVENLTDRIVYIDRGRSFVYTNNNSSPMFVASSQTNAFSQGRGVITQTDSQMAWGSFEANTTASTTTTSASSPSLPTAQPRCMSGTTSPISCARIWYMRHAKRWAISSRHPLYRVLTTVLPTASLSTKATHASIRPMLRRSLFPLT